MSQDNSLTAADVAKLMEEPSAENRASAASKIAEHLNDGALSEAERALAEDIFRVMVRDVEQRVRRALSESLRETDDLPRDIALSLANDVEDIAVPFLELTQSLSDEDLVAIIQSKGEEHHKAIARREIVSETISDALVGTKNEDVVATLVSNDGATMSESTMNKVLDDFGHVKKISNPMAQRATLPLDVAERLVSLVSDKIQEKLLTHQELSSDMAMDLILQSRERATVSLLDGTSEAPDVHALVKQLHQNGRLTPTLIIRALCMGDLVFFETALAQKADIPVVNVYKLVHDKGDLALQRLFAKAKMPETMIPLARVALDVATDMEIQSSDDREQFRSVMLERVLTHFEEDFDADNLDYFISKLATHDTGTAVHA